MEILGLDKIRHLEDNKKVNVSGLEQIRPSEERMSVTGLDKVHPAEGEDAPAFSSFASRLIALADRARELDADCREYGAGEHRYRFGRVLPVSAVRAFEERHGITLPVGYTEFLTQVGNGGAGPDHGLFSLEKIEEAGYRLHKEVCLPLHEIRIQPDFRTLLYDDEAIPSQIHAGVSPYSWSAWQQRWQKASAGEDRAESERLYREAFNGMIQIIDSGNQTGYLLACAGPLRGQAVYFRGVWDTPEPLFKPWEDFVLEYFKSVIQKYERL